MESENPNRKYRRRDHWIPPTRQASSIATPPKGGEVREPAKTREDQLFERVESRILSSLSSRFPEILKENSKPDDTDEEGEDIYGV